MSLVVHTYARKNNEHVQVEAEKFDNCLQYLISLYPLLAVGCCSLSFLMHHSHCFKQCISYAEHLLVQEKKRRRDPSLSKIAPDMDPAITFRPKVAQLVQHF